MIALVACGAIGVGSFFILPSSEPQYGGKPMFRWLEQLYAHYPRVDAEARDALRAMGQPAVRYLIRHLEREPPIWRLRLALMTAEIPVLNRLFNIHYVPRFLAAKTLAEIGPTAKSAIPALERAAKEADAALSIAARAALIRIREESIDLHIAIKGQIDTLESVRPALLLMELGPYAKRALPALLEGMRSTNDRVRLHSIMALPKIGFESPEYVPPLQRLLSDPGYLVRYQALDGLAEFGPLAIAALPQARESLKDTNNLVRAAALTFFEKVLSDEEFAAVRDEVVRATQDADSLVSQVAQSVLSKRPHDKSGNVTNR
jgi:HEAT repeat protein